MRTNKRTTVFDSCPRTRLPIDLAQHYPVQIVSYPPGIALMMPGEKAGTDNKAIIDYLLAMELFDGHFPGFEHDNHGVELERDSQGQLIYKVHVIKH
ncbi:hypothetical protein [Pseudomonas corrugata]|uniref:Orn/Lys/Arg family decarboxylase n=1 Tax=Pseudomonas corrugata TaxID=47879 RepID=UPI002FCDC3EF